MRRATASQVIGEKLSRTTASPTRLLAEAGRLWNAALQLVLEAERLERLAGKHPDGSGGRGGAGAEDTGTPARTKSLGPAAKKAKQAVKARTRSFGPTVKAAKAKKAAKKAAQKAKRAARA